MNEQVQEKNIYQPYLMEIIKVVPETGDTKTFHIQFQEASLRESFSFVAGQFAEYSVFGEGEATFCISSSPTRMSHLEFSVKRVGRVTHALHQLNEGDTIGFRGPYGNHFPLDKLKEKGVLVGDFLLDVFCVFVQFFFLGFFCRGGATPYLADHNILHAQPREQSLRLL